MAARSLPDGWDGVLARITRYGQPLILAGALEHQREGGWMPLALTIRGGIHMASCDHRYYGAGEAELRLFRVPVDNVVVLEFLNKGTLGPWGNFRQLPTPPIKLGVTPMWITQASQWGPMPATPTPRMCLDFSWASSVPVVQPNNYRWDDHALVNGGPYYPSLEAAVLEVLFGRTDTDTSPRPTWKSYCFISLAENTAYLGRAEYIADDGLVVDVREGRPGSIIGHDLHVIWRMNPTDHAFERVSTSVSQAGAVTVPTEAPPLSYSVALTRGGELVDEIAGTARARQPEVFHIAASVLPDAFEFFDSVWRNLFDVPLLRNPSPSDIAGLTEVVSSQAECSVRMSELASLLKACTIADELVPGKPLSGDATALRIQRALEVKLAIKKADPDWSIVADAVGTLLKINQLRVAMQHHMKEAGKPDLPTALNRLGIDYPPDWTTAWNVIRYRAVEAIDALRRLVRSHLTNR